MTITSTTLDPIADLWRELRAWLADAMRDLRGPVEVARTRAQEAHAAITRRLRLIESLLMKLLLIEASIVTAGFQPACRGQPGGSCILLWSPCRLEAGGTSQRRS